LARLIIWDAGAPHEQGVAAGRDETLRRLNRLSVAVSASPRG
jgi:hypothetical protein